MKLLSINLGRKQEIDTGKPAPEDTGIFKTPVEGPVMVGALGLEGDFIASAKHHGGPDQAVYIYGMGDYDFWREELDEFRTWPVSDDMWKEWSGAVQNSDGRYSAEFARRQRLPGA